MPGDARIGDFIVSEFYNLPIVKDFSVVASTANNGNYTVKSIAHNPSSGETEIIVNEAVPSSTADGQATLDIDSDGNPLYVDGRHWYNTGTNTHYSSTHLDCNRCHTQNGANNAPGRVLVPVVN